MSLQGLYAKRRSTLFNIYSFAEHTTLRNATPELILEGCDFEYFLGPLYESLITIETNSLAKTATSMQETLPNGASYVET